MEKDPKAFRIAATVLLVRDDPFEVLMVRRHEKAVFASRLVFPGGVIEPEDHDDGWAEFVDGDEGLDPDERALRICAIRETWEETSVLLAAGRDGEPVTVPTGMTDAPFREIVRASGGRLALDRLHLFGHWVTPEDQPRRFDTRFYLARAPEGQSAVADGVETVDLAWVAVTDRTETSLMFPTLMNLERLALSTDSASAIAAALTLTPFVVRPVRERRADGSTVIRIPAAAGYGVTEFESR